VFKNIKKISQSLLDINRNNSVTPVQQDTSSRKIVCNSEERKHSAIDTRELPSLLDLKLLQNKFNRR
jgi:hypothetical protein